MRSLRIVSAVGVLSKKALGALDSGASLRSSRDVRATEAIEYGG